MQAVANGSADEAADSRWMTYTELAAARRISTSSAIKLVVRHGWRRQKDNHGTMRALVPPDWWEPARGKNGDADAYVREAIGALETSVTVLRERAEAAEQMARLERERANRAVQAHNGELMRSNSLRGRIDNLRAELADTLEALEIARHEAWEALQAAEQMREADTAWHELGRIERVRRAWRGDW
jgi:hypothetical protein